MVVRGQRLVPPEKGPRYPLYKSMGRFQGRPGRMHPTGIRIVNPLARIESLDGRCGGLCVILRR